MIKVKNWLSDEAVVVGYTQGRGAKAPTFGALILAQNNRAGNLQYVGKSAGFTQSETKEVLGN
jgi:bifunctional non-homologous end joining protein LigD